MESTLSYSVIAPKQPGNLVIFRFTLDGRLIGIEFNPDATIHFKNKVGSYLPETYTHLRSMEVYKGCEITCTNDIDTSFAAFWTAYNYKVGNKVRVARKWQELPETDRLLALGFIRRYRNWCDRKKIEYCYPETYLNQRRWENHID